MIWVDRGKALIMQVIEDLRLIKSLWPGVKVIWSKIIPRKSWCNAMDPRVMNKTHKNTNCDIKDPLCAGLGQFLLHPEISDDKPELNQADGVHLSEVGLDIFIRDLQQGLCESLGLSGGQGSKERLGLAVA